MEFLEIVGWVVSGTVLGVALPYIAASRDLALRRRMETIDIFMRVAARAHGYGEDRDAGGIGMGEQVAALYLMADLANRDKWLRKAAKGHMAEVVRWSTNKGPGSAQILSAARSAQSLIK